MAGYGSWEDRPWERREGERDLDRWRREREGRGREPERWRERPDEELGARSRDDWRREGWRHDWRSRGEERRIGGWRDAGAGAPEGEQGWERGWDDRSGWQAGGRAPWPAGEERWREPRHDWRTSGEGEWRGVREDWREPRDWRVRGEEDRPWVERGPRTRAREDEGRGLVEWEDRGPLKWLGDRFREATGKPARGPKGYTRSDARIHEDVCERIARSGIDAEDVEVKVERHEVTLTGSVAHREDKWRLEALADGVFGVDEVHNHLRITRGERSSTGGDVHH